MTWIRVPVHTPMTPYTVYEHTPAYSYKEYPRDINRVGWQEPVWEWKWVDNNRLDKNDLSKLKELNT